MDDELERATATLVAYLTEHGPTPFVELVPALRAADPELADDEDDLVDLIEAIASISDAIHVCQGDDEVVASSAALLEGWGGVTLRDGEIEVAPNQDGPDEERTALLVAALAALYERDEVDEPYETAAGLVLDLLADPPVPPGPLPPLDELLTAAGLERRGGPWIGRVGSGWKTPDERLAERRLQAAVERYGLDGHGRSDLVALLDADQALQAGGDLPTGRTLAQLRHGLGHAEVTAAVSELLLGSRLTPARISELQRLFGALLDGAEGSAAAGANVLLARAAEHDGAHRAMELYIDNALVDDPQYWPALADAAWFAEDRGDAGRAISLLTETRVPAFADEIARLSRFHRSGDNKVGRNDPCPCGSGRKYKACCMGQGGFSLAERSGWLLAKAQGFLGRAPRARVVEDLVFVAAGGEVAHLPDDPRLAEHPMVLDLALFEDGYLRLFLAERGHLLPADERAMAETWLDARLGVWRVVGPEGDGVVVEKDGVTERIERPGALAEEVPGTAVLLRLLPVPDHGNRVLCATAVPPEALSRVEELLAAEASAGELARLLGLLGDIPPETVDDGDPLVLRSVSFVLPDDLDLDDLADRLDAELVDPDESGEWIEEADAERPEDVPLGSITLTEEVLLVRAASEPRAERLLAVVARVAPEAELDRDDRRTRDDIVAELLRG